LRMSFCPQGGGARRQPQAEGETFPLKAANEALARLRSGQIQGAAVLLLGQAMG
jgi:hypothetical protein